MVPYSYSVRLYDLQDSELHAIAKSTARSVVSKKHKFALWTVVVLSSASIVGLPIAAIALAFERKQTERRSEEAFLKLKYIKDLQVENNICETTGIGWSGDDSVHIVLGNTTREIHEEACKAARYDKAARMAPRVIFSSIRDVTGSDEQKAYYGTCGPLPLMESPSAY